MSSLREKATKGVLWSALERFSQQGSAFVIQLILARLLTPEDFGLIALVIVFIAISRVVVDSGFARAIIQKKEISDEDLSTVFYVNVVISLAVTALLWIAAPWIAQFYEQPQLISVLRYLSFSLIMGSLGGVHKAILIRELKFKALFRVSMPATVIAGIVAVFFAWKGWGVWALVVNMLLSEVLRSCFLWMQSHWRPSFVFSVDSLRALFPFGSRLALSGVLDLGFENIYVLVVGKFYAPFEVGFFERARTFQKLPIMNIQAILHNVSFPLFSSIQDDPERLRRGMKKALFFACLISFTIMAWLAAVSKPLTLFLLGEKWLPLATYLTPLCFLGALYPLHAMNLSVLNALGRSDLFLRLEVIKKILTVINIFITYRFGVLAMIYGMMITSILSLFFNTFYTGKYVNYGLWAQLKDCFSVILLGITLYGGARFLLSLLSYDPFFTLLISSTFLLLVFLFGIRLQPREMKRDINHFILQLPLSRSVKSLLKI